MSKSFLKFKRRYQSARVLKSLAGGLSAGCFVAGILLVLSKLDLIVWEPGIATYLGAGVMLLTMVALFLIFRKSDKKLAEELDARFALHEKLQTMVAYRDADGEMLDLQRADAEQSLAAVPVKKFRPGRLWICLLALCIGGASLAAGLVVENRRGFVPPEEIKPFALSAMQAAGIEELIKYVDASEMEAEYKAVISAELAQLLEDLKVVTTEPEMHAVMNESMTRIAGVTYDSSSMTEILNALWNTEDTYLKDLAKVLNTSNWTEPDWGDFAEKYAQFRDLVHGKTEQSSTEGEQPAQTEPLTEVELHSALKWAFENAAMKAGLALTESGIEKDDPLYAAVNDFMNAEQGSANAEHLFGLAVIAKNMSAMTYSEALADFDNTHDGMAETFYSVIAQQKTNTNVGEYIMKKLSSLFMVSVPEFERPEFANNGSGGNGSDNKNDDDKPSDGGLGEGAVYGSNDLVLDPLTGEYVEYGTLLDKYYAVMYEKVDNGSYTDEQIEIIKNYFALLYSGIQDEGGN